MIDLKNYYLIKCFRKDEYRKSFNNGTDIHITSMKYFWKIENPFEQDFEGLIFKQPGEGCFFAAKPGLKEVVKNISSVEDAKNKSEFLDFIIPIKDSSLSIEGYICCFYLLEKKNVCFKAENESRMCRMYFLDDAEKYNFEKFLTEYIKDKAAYVSIYEATKFCDIFYKGMINKGYNVACDRVEYKDLLEEQKIQLLQQNDIKHLIFTKPILFNYQKEFRIFLSKKEKIRDFISENGINVLPSLIGNFDYCI